MLDILQKHFWPLLIVLLGLAAGLAAWRLWPVLFPPVVVRAPLDGTCLLHQTPCTARFPDGGEVTLTLTPRPVPALEIFSIEVSASLPEISKAEVDFSGVRMNMGYNRPALQALGGGRFGGQGALPVCVLDRMDWEAKVLLYTPAGLYAAPFRFEVRAPHAGTT